MRRGVAVVAALLLLGGCGAPAVPVDVPRVPTSENARETDETGASGDGRATGTAEVCRSVISDAPTWLGELARRDVRPTARTGSDRGDRDRGDRTDAETLTAAWGDPAAILRCGVPQPDAFRPSSACIRIEGVDWFAEKAERGYVFTTVGRAARVEVSVPDDYRPESDLLVDLAPAIDRNNPVREPCV